MKVKSKISLPALIRKATFVFNKFIRERDKDRGCISCGKEITEAGHYYSAGHYSALKFNELNVNGQCTQCNCYFSGNLIHYRNGLLKKIGEQKLNILDSAATRGRYHKWGRGELEIIFKEYSKKVKQFET